MRVASVGSLPALHHRRSVAMLSHAGINNLLTVKDRLSGMSFIHCGFWFYFLKFSVLLWALCALNFLAFFSRRSLPSDLRMRIEETLLEE